MVIEDGTPKILTFGEKHGNLVYIVNSEDELHAVCKDVLKQRLFSLQYYGYLAHDEPENKTGFETKEQIEALPDGEVKSSALRLWRAYQCNLKEFAECRDFNNAVKAAISYTFNAYDKYYVRNKAYFVLRHHSDYEYEEISLENPLEIPRD